MARPARSALLLFVLSGWVAGSAIAAPPVKPTLAAATRALVEGRYDEVDQIVDKLDLKDPAVVVVKARAEIARGRYQPAEKLLQPAAARMPVGAAALELGLLQHELRRPEAARTLAPVAAGRSSTDAAALVRAARAMRALGLFHEANSAFQEALRAAPTDPDVNTAFGELLLEKYNTADAVKSFRIALEADPRWVPALVGMAEALGDDNPPQAVAAAKRALEIDSSSVPAHLFLARQAVDAGRRAEAAGELQQALAVNPSSLAAHAHLAAIAYVEDRQADYEAEIAKALAIAPRSGDAYRIAGEYAAHNYRFDEAVVLTRKALAIEPDEPQALLDLGVDLLRTGDEPGARKALEAAFRLDDYNVVTKNLLEMMDQLDKFTSVRDGDLVVRLDKAEAPVLQDYAVPLAHKALETLAARYRFVPRGPILIEIFPRHDDFAVRNVGLPGMIGALGACFGRVVTMDSPKARPPGTFQWEATLWHELAHVITLQMSNQRVPRWLTEGISVYEEKRARAEWGREMDVEFAQLLDQGKTLKLRDLNAAFTDPTTISLAYYQASLLVEHIVTAYGDEGLRKLLLAYGQGLDTDAALKTALNTDFARLQVGYDQMLDRMFGTLRRALEGGDAITASSATTLRAYAGEHPRSYPAQLALGDALRKSGAIDEAMQAYERAAALVPVARGDDSPHARMAEIALVKKDRPRAIQELTALVAVDYTNVEAARQLAKLLQEAGVRDPAKLGPVYARIVAIDPFDADAHARLGRVALERNDAAGAVREFKTVLAIGPVDPAAAYTDLAEGYFQTGNRIAAKQQTLAALEIAPTYERAQELLLKLVGGTPQ